MTSSTKQAAVRRIKQKKSQTPKSPPPSQIQIHQASRPHHQEGSNSHPLTLPAFRKQFSPSTGDPASTSKKKKQITHVLSDDKDDYDEYALITTSCNNMDCKALLLENKTLKETVKKLQRRLDIAGKEL